jgi:RNA polymerase sigma-70 factor (ECF subfamily)
VLDGKARHSGNGDFRTWLFGVIRTTAQDHRRREWVRRLGLMKIRSGETRNPSEPAANLQRAETAQRFAAALDALPARQREVLHLVFYQGLSIAGAGAVLGISTGSARTHYERGKKTLSVALREFKDQQVTHENGSTLSAGVL